MEYFCNEIKEKACVDFGNKEIQDIMKAVDILMNRFVGEFNTKYPDMKIDRLALCGSMAEKTRIWRSEDGEDGCDLEFDYLAIVKSLQNYGDYMFEHNAYGQVEVKYKRTDSESVSGEYVNLSTNIKLTFFNNLQKCITKKCERNWCTLSLKNQYLPHDIRESDGCSFCSVCMQTGSLICHYTPVYHASGRLRFLWKSKYQPLRTSYVACSDFNAIFKNAKRAVIKYYLTSNADIDTTDIHDFLQKIYWKDEKVSEIHVDIDFHPVIELDITKVIQKTRMIPVFSEKIILVPRPFYRELIFNRLMYGSDYKFIDYVLKLLHINKKCEVKVTPDLRIDENYFLFPKCLYHIRECWRLSTYQIELNILNEASKEHRLAYCVLKYLILAIKQEEVFPTIFNYEAKLAVIQHIKHCKTPDIGAHICVLNILHDIVLCKEGSSSMDHPILHLDLYDEIFQNNVHKSFRTTLPAVCLKILILILVNNRSDYTVKDLHIDAILINLYSDIILGQYLEISKRSGETRFPEFNDIKESFNELHSLVTRRKEHASKDELIKVLVSLRRRGRIRKLKMCVVQQNLDDLILGI